MGHQATSPADLLRTLRRGRHLTQQELAAADMTPGEISRFETGKRPISKTRAQQLARVLEGVTAAQLMGLDDGMPAGQKIQHSGPQ